ncbi:MAG: NAD(P)/FAD-dependent oxidoreductase, partial [Acidilobus sp.]
MRLEEVGGLLRGSDERAVFMFQGVISSGDVVNSLTKSMAEAGVSLRVGAVRSRRGRLYYDGSPIEADLVFVAAGPWTRELVDVKLRVYRCSAHSVEAPGLPGMIVEDDENEFYLVPESSSRGIAGGPDSPLPDPEDGFRVTPYEAYDVLDRVSRRVPPAEAARPMSSWAAPCSSGPDGLPLVGEVGDGVFVIAGLDGAGLTLSPGLSRLVVNIAEGVVEEDPALSPARKFSEGPVEPFESICMGLSSSSP